MIVIPFGDIAKSILLILVTCFGGWKTHTQAAGENMNWFINTQVRVNGTLATNLASDSDSITDVQQVLAKIKTNLNAFWWFLSFFSPFPRLLSTFSICFSSPPIKLLPKKIMLWFHSFVMLIRYTTSYIEIYHKGWEISLYTYTYTYTVHNSTFLRAYKVEKVFCVLNR